MKNISKLKKDFPIFRSNPDLIYLDSTATSLKPISVIESVSDYYSNYSANIHRGLYQISEKASQKYEEVRDKTAKFIGVLNREEIIFTRSTTESINLLAYSLGREILSKNDEIVVSVMEHHSNFVPWQVLAFEIGADFKIIDIDENGYLSIYKKNKSQDINLQNIITNRTKILALTYISNVLGTINPLKEVIRKARKINPKIIIIIDAAQATPHLVVDVKKLDADFIVFSSHKMLGPTGVGVLWGKRSLLDSMFPFNYGGDMIEEVSLDNTTFAKPPHKFEAGTPHIAGVIGFGKAIDYLEEIGLSKIHKHEKKLTIYALSRLKQVFGDDIIIIGPKNAEDKIGVIAFTFSFVHPHDIGQILDEQNIAIRVGHHCAQPLHKRLKLNSTCRISFYLYNNEDDIEKLITGLKRVTHIFKR